MTSSPGKIASMATSLLQPTVYAAEVLQGRIEERLQRRDHEVDLLEVVDPVGRTHHPFQIEADAIGRRVVQREDRLRMAGDDAGAIDPQALRRRKQAELDRVPVEARQVVQLAEAQRAQAAFTVGLHVVGERRVGEHRHVAEHVVEDVRFLEVVQLVRPADELAGGEAAVSQVVEKHVVRDQAWHGDHGPAGQTTQVLVDPGEVWNAGPMQVQGFQPAEKRIARAARQQRSLPFVEGDPDLVLGVGVARPTLIDRPVRRSPWRRPTAMPVGAHGGENERNRAKVPCSWARVPT